MSGCKRLTRTWIGRSPRTHTLQSRRMAELDKRRSGTFCKHIVYIMRKLATANPWISLQVLSWWSVAAVKKSHSGSSADCLPNKRSKSQSWVVLTVSFQMIFQLFRSMSVSSIVFSSSICLSCTITSLVVISQSLTFSGSINGFKLASYIVFHLVCAFEYGITFLLMGQSSSLKWH